VSRVDPAHERQRAAAERPLDDRAELLLEGVLEEHPCVAQPGVLPHRCEVALDDRHAVLQHEHERVRTGELSAGLCRTAAERILVEAHDRV
jgi:hypothetical protein